MRQLVGGIGIGFLISACAGVSWNYKYYGMDLVSYDGTLLGKTPADDLSFHLCQPDDKVKGKCVVMLVDEFERLRMDKAREDEQLKDCQKNCHATEIELR